MISFLHKFKININTNLTRMNIGCYYRRSFITYKNNLFILCMLKSECVSTFIFIFIQHCDLIHFTKASTKQLLILSTITIFFSFFIYILRSIYDKVLPVLWKVIFFFVHYEVFYYFYIILFKSAFIVYSMHI